MTKKILVIVAVVIMLLMMAAPVSAVVKPPTTVKDALFKGVGGAIMDLQNQITALTQRVDTIENSHLTEYRAGSYTTPSDECLKHYIVTFSSPMPNTNYRVSITNADPSPLEGVWGNCPKCTLTIDSKTVTNFTFTWRGTTSGPDTYNCLNFNHKFDYIAIADN